MDKHATTLLAPVWLYVPANLEIPKTHKDVENEIIYWLHTIIVGQYGRKHDLDNTTRINRKTIRQMVGRSEFKQMFFADVFFGRNQAVTPLTELFRREFPAVSGFIQSEKVGDYRVLAQHMQRAESRFVIDIVCRRLMEFHRDIPIITVHDSILTVREHAATVKRIMVEEFQRMGIKATVRTDREQ